MTRRTHHGARRLAPLALAAVLALGATPAQSATRTFMGGTGFLGTASNWSGGVLPGPTDDALLGVWDTETGVVLSFKSFTGTGRLRLNANGSLTFAATSSIGSLELNGGHLIGTGALAVSNASTWTSGAMTGTGTTTFVGGLTINAGAKLLAGRQLILGGDSSWKDGGDITFSAGAVLTNNAGKNFVDKNAFAASISNGSGTGNGFVNAGTYAKTGTGTTTISTTFTNSGKLALNAGSLILTGNSIWSGNSAIVNAGRLSFGDSTWSGNGSIALSGAGVLYNAALKTLDDQNTGPASLTSSAGNDFVNAGSYLKSGAGTTTISTKFTNSGKLALNAGRLILTGNSTWVGNSAIVNADRLSFGDSTWSGTGSIALSGTGALTNAAGKTFDDQNTGPASLSTSAGNGFVNAGTYLKSGVGATTINTTFSNSGALEQQVGAGALNLFGGISGDGSVSVNGTMVIGGSNTSMGSLSVNGDLSVGGALSVSKASTWNSGTLSGFVTFNKGLTILGSGQTVNNKTLWLDGSINWMLGNITLSNDALFRNDGSFTDNSIKSRIDARGTGNNFFDNRGTYTRSNIGTTTLKADFYNGGTLTVNQGKMALERGINSRGGIPDQSQIGGSINVASGATLVLGANSLTRNLSIAGTAPDMLTLDANDLLVKGDYDNANFGVGNAFNRRNGVSGTGRILALGVGAHNALQTLSGDRVSMVDAATAVLTLPTMRVGGAAVSTSFKINNAGDAGPSLRGAIKTNGITTASLSGSGVTAQNWSALAYGTSTGAYTITYAPTTAGNVLAVQQLAIVNNFDNIAGQTLSFAGGVAYNAALASVLSPIPVTMASQRVGGSLSQALTLSNLAPTGVYSEKLNASVSAGAGTTAGGVVSLLAAGDTSHALWVGVDTSTAGLKSGTVSVALASTGQGTSGLSTLTLAGQQVQVSGKVYAPAVAQLDSNVLKFGIVHVGDTVGSGITVRNGAAPLALNDALVGSAGGGGGGFTVGGSLAGMLAGAQDSSSLIVSLDTSHAGVYGGTADLAFASHNPDMSDLALAGQQVALSAQVNNYAELGLSKLSGAGSFAGSGSNSYTLDFGTLTLGDGALSAELMAGNVAQGLSDMLGLQFELGTASLHFTLNGFGPVIGLGAGEHHGLQISFSGLLAGAFDDVITLHATGSNASGYAGALSDVRLHLVGNVVAVPEPSTWAQLALGLVGLVGVTARRRGGARVVARALARCTEQGQQQTGGHAA
jgi:hypothetical protein